MEEVEMPDAAEQQLSAIETNAVEQPAAIETNPYLIPLPPSPPQLILPTAPTHQLPPLPRTNGKPEAKHQTKKSRVAPKNLKRKTDDSIE